LKRNDEAHPTHTQFKSDPSVHDNFETISYMRHHKHLHFDFELSQLLWQIRVDTIAKANVMLVLGCQIRAALENLPRQWYEMN